MPVPKSAIWRFGDDWATDGLAPRIAGAISRSSAIDRLDRAIDVAPVAQGIEHPPPKRLGRVPLNAPERKQAVFSPDDIVVGTPRHASGGKRCNPLQSATRRQ